MPATTGRSRGRQGVHAGAQGAVGEHFPKIMGALSASIVMIILVLAFTKIGHDIDAATQRFMLYYAGVFALIGLTGSVLLGLVATDRVVMTPGHRVMAQAVHRAISFGTLAFLIIHILTEILAQRSHVIDGVIPFLSPFRTFYVGLGTIASDLIVLLVATSIIRKRFTAHGKAWRWRAIHYTSYVAFVFGVLHGLLGGRTAKPYVDWSYGFAIAVTALGLAVRFLATSLRPKEALSAPPSADRPTAQRSPAMRAAALSMTQAQLGGTVQVLPATATARNAVGMPGTGSWAALPAAPGWSGPIPAVPGPAHTVSGPFQAIGAAPPSYAAESPSAAYHDLGFTPLGAPPYGDDVPVPLRGRPYADTSPWAPPVPPRPALAGPAGAGNAGAGNAARQPRYEPGYDGPPRFEGAPRRHVPQDDLSTRPYGSPGSRPAIGTSGPGASGQPGRGDTGQPRRGDRPGAGDPITGPIPRIGTGPMPRAGTGPMPRADSGPIPRVGTGPMPRAGTGPMPRAGTGPMPRAGTGPNLRPDTSPAPRAGAGPMPRADAGPIPPAGTGAMPTTGSVGSQQGPGTGRGRRGTGRPARGAGSTDARHRQGPGPTRGDE